MIINFVWLKKPLKINGQIDQEKNSIVQMTKDKLFILFKVLVRLPKLMRKT